MIFFCTCRSHVRSLFLLFTRLQDIVDNFYKKSIDESVNQPFHVRLGMISVFE
jgi:hypothetical protein